MTQAAIFDLDGTLIDLPVDWEALFDKLRQIMHTQNVRPLTLTISSLDAQTRKLAFAVWDEAELAVAPKFKLIDEGMKVYHENANKPKILITMQGKKAVNAILDQMKIQFDGVITREDSLSRERQLAMAIEKLKIPARDALFVGDADSDAAAAQKTGCQFHMIR